MIIKLDPLEDTGIFLVVVNFDIMDHVSEKVLKLSISRVKPGEASLSAKLPTFFFCLLPISTRAVARNKSILEPSNNFDVSYFLCSFENVAEIILAIIAR